MNYMLKRTFSIIVALATITWTFSPVFLLTAQAATGNATVSAQPDDYNTSDINRGVNTVFAMSVFTLADADNDDTLDSVKFTISGTAVAGDFDSFKIYQEAGANQTFDSGVDTLIGTQSTVTIGELTVDVDPDATIPASATRYYIVADMAASVTDGGYFKIDLPADMLTVSAATLATTAFTGNVYADIDSGGGAYQLYVNDAEYVDANTIEVVFSKEVDTTTAQTATNYTFGGGTVSGNPDSATLQPGNMRVRLAKANGNIVSSGRDTITVSANVTDMASNPNQTTGSVTIMGGGGGAQGSVLISEVQVAGATAGDEFIELYNPTATAINLNTSAVKLHIVNSAGTDGHKTLTFVNDSIPANGYFLITPATGYDGTPTADATYVTSGNTLVDNGAVYVSYSATANSSIIDEVGWGSSTIYEGANTVNSAYGNSSLAITANSSIERKANNASTATTMQSGGADASYGNGYDTENNFSDFIIRTAASDPQNSSSAAETQGGAGYGASNMPPMIMHMSVMRAIKSNAVLEVAARISDESGALAASNTALYYCAAGSANCTEAADYTAVAGTSVGSGYFKFTIPAATRNATNIETNDIRYVIKAIDPSDATKIKYMSQSPQADMTCDSGTCATSTIFTNPIVIDVITSDQATTFSCNQTVSGTVQESGSGLDGAFVFLEGTALSTTTGRSGIFSFSNVCPGGYQVIGAKAGYTDAMYWVNSGQTGVSLTMGAGYMGGGGDYTKPHIMHSFPSDMTTGHPTGDNIYVVFDSEMSSTTIDDTTITITDNVYLTTDGTDAVAGTVTYYSDNTGRPSGAPSDSYLLVYDPTASLSPGTGYALIITQAVTDSNGNPLEGNRMSGGNTLSFTTAYDVGTGGTQASTYSYGQGANFPPYVVGTTPGSGGYNVPVNTNINLTFSEAMSSSSINTTNITMYTVTNPYTSTETETAFTGFSVSLDNSGKIAIINPTSNLSTSTRYRVKVLGDVTSAKGTVMSQTATSEMFSLDFDTSSSSAGDSSAPTISGTYPSNNDTGILSNLSSVNIGFSEAMDPATINSNTVKLKQGNTALTATVEYEVGEQAAYIMPSSALTPGGTYIIEVIAGSSGVSDVSGNYLADQSSTLAGTQNYNASFTVSTTADSDYPLIEFARCDDFSCAITFSEPMNSAKVGESDYTAGYSVLKKTNYTIKEGPAGTTSWGGISAESLTNVNVKYDQMENTVMMDGLSLTSGNDFQVTVANVGDRFINAGNVATHQIAGSTNSASFQGPIANSSATGGMMGPGGPGPMMGPPTMTGTGASATTGMGGGGGYDFAGQWEKPTNVMPMNMMAGKTTTYFVEFSPDTAIPVSGTIKMTFPSGTDVSSAELMAETHSMTNKDINGMGSGTVKIDATEATQSGGADDDGITVNVSSRTVTATIDATNDAIAAGDMIMFDLKGIKNPTVARGYDTNGYTVDIKTFNASGALLDSMTSFPYFINQAGDYTLSGTVTATGATTGTATIYLGSWMTGPQEATATFSGGTATYSFTGLSEGDYHLHTEPSLTLNSIDFNGYMQPESIFVNSGDCPSNTCTKNFSFTRADSGAALTVQIYGDFSSLSATDRNVDIWAGSYNGHVMKTVTIPASDYSSTAYSTTLYLNALGEWHVGMGPAMPKGTMMMGPPPMPAWIPPQDVEVTVSGSLGTPTWSERSDTANDGTIDFTITSATNQIVGYVIDSSGTGIANVEVDAHRTQGGFGMPAFAQTDTNGKFTIKVTTGSYEVNAWMPGLPWSPGRVVDVRADTSNVATDGNSTADVYKDNGTTLVVDATAGYNSAVPEEELLLNLNKSSTTISGKLLDNNGDTVAYAPVWAYSQSTGEHMPSGTDSAGNYTIYVGNGNWYVEAFIPGIGDVSYENNPVSVSGSNRSDINVKPSASTSFSVISGTVTISGSTVSNVSVWVDRGTYHNQTNTNSSGAYRLTVPANSGYSLKAWAPDYGELDPVTVNASSDVTQNFTVEAGSMHTLTINFSNQSGLKSGTEAFIDIFDPTVFKGNHKRIDDLSNASSTTMSVKTGTSYEIHMFVPGVGGIEPTCTGNAACTAGTGDASDTWSISEDTTIAMAMPDTSNMHTLTVTVNNASSTVLADAFVWLGSSSFHVGEPTNSSGVATLKVPAGTYDLGADKPGYTSPATTSLTISADTERTINLTSNSYTLSGTITNPSAAAVSKAWVWADKVTSATDLSFAGGWTGSEVNSDGTYELSISDGYWLVHVVSDAYAEKVYTDSNGDRAAIQINGSSVTGADITMAARSNYTAVQPKSSSITPASGGTIDDTGASGTGVKLVIPPSALGTGTSAGTVNIADTYSVPTTGSITPLGGKGKEISATNSAGQSITSLSGSANIKINYSESNIPSGVSESQLLLAYFDDSSNQWVEIPATIDTTNNTISGSTTHFSQYIVGSSADTGGPTQPGTPSATVTSSSVALSWTASTDSETSVDGYQILRSTDNSTFTTINSTDPWSTGSYVSSSLNSGLTYTDSDVSAGTTYYYYVVAFDTAGNHSTASSTLTTATSAAAVTGGGAITVTPVPVTPEPETEPEVEVQVEIPTPTIDKPITEMTVTEIKAKIAEILSVIEQLQEQLSAMVSKYTFSKAMKRGSRNDEVKELQKVLGITADGIFGPNTEQAVKDFQSEHNLDVDGVVGPQTRATLNSL